MKVQAHLRHNANASSQTSGGLRQRWLRLTALGICFCAGSATPAVANATDKREREDLSKWAYMSERRDRLNAMISLAQSEQPIPIKVESLDTGPYLFNCDNGTLDLRTGELRPSTRRLPDQALLGRISVRGRR